MKWLSKGRTWHRATAQSRFRCLAVMQLLRCASIAGQGAARLLSRRAGAEPKRAGRREASGGDVLMAPTEGGKTERGLLRRKHWPGRACAGLI